MTLFDRVDRGDGYTRFHGFDVSTGTPFCDFSREFRVLVSAVTESGRTLSPGVDAVLEVVRMAVYEQFSTLTPTTRSRTPHRVRCGRPSAIWQIMGHLPSTAIVFFRCLFLRRERGHPPHRAPARRPWAGQGRVPSQTPSWQTGSSHNPIVMSINDPTDPWIDKTSNY